MKSVQVLATFFGDRRTYPFNADNVKIIINKQIETLQTLDTGCDSDLLIVNHDIQSQDAYKFLDDINGTQLKNGVVKILHRPMINHDVSFGSYKYAFYKYQNEYDYWFFNEDDILPITNNFMVDMINILQNDNNIGFVAALQFTDSPNHHFGFDEEGYITKTGYYVPHAHGGVGVTSTKIIKDIINKIPNYLNTPNINYDGQSILNNGGYSKNDRIEIEFTYDFVKAGYKLKCYSDGYKFKRLQDGRNL